MTSAASLETDRLTLTRLVPADADDMVSVLADLALYAFTGGEAPSRERLRSRYEALVRGSPDPATDWHNWIIRTRVDGAATGYVQATATGRRADLAWLVGTAHQGAGFAAEAARAVIGWLSDHGVEQVRAHIHPDHRASQRVAERIGMHATTETDAEGEIVWAS